MLDVPARSQSLWIATSSQPRRPRLEGDLEVDVAIVGGGITGITAALLLQRAGKRVCVLEARRVAEGVTGHTTAHVTEAIDARYATLERRFGRDGARLAAQASRAAIDFIEAHATKDCGFEKLPGWLFTERDDDLEELHQEYEAAKRAGLPVTMTDEVPLPFATRAAVVFPNQAQIHPRAYLLPLIDEIERGGGLIFEETRVVAIEGGDPCLVRTNQGNVRAAFVVEATHAPLNRVFLQTKIGSRRSYVLGAVVAQQALHGLFWDTDDPYHYLRSAGDVLLVGGEDHKTGNEDDTFACYERLASYLAARFGVRELRHRWSAQVIEPVDGLPFIGRNSMSKRVFVATGFSGTGITFGTLAAMILSDEILGRTNPWGELLSATRVKPIAAFTDYVTENVDFPLHFVKDRLTAAEVRRVDDIERGQGKLVRVHGRKLAVYRDDRGELHALSPVCPHLGCHVTFNDAERTWDCPCHGSRFTPDGRVVNGPATGNLKPHALPETTRETKHTHR